VGGWWSLKLRQIGQYESRWRYGQWEHDGVLLKSRFKRILEYLRQMSSRLSLLASPNTTSPISLLTPLINVAQLLE
jgi:hypothetical protein